MFSYSRARAHGLSDRRLYALRDGGLIEQLGRGLFLKADAVGDADPDLIEIAHRAPRATLCLTTALARHGLTDAIPARIDAALPRGHRHPATATPVSWHAFAADTFDIGREEFALTAQTSIGLYNPQRCIIDAFRCVTWKAPSRRSRRCVAGYADAGSQPAELLAMARAFPKAEPGLRSALEILL